jgi:SAM-dependent methyltransferase
LQTEILTSVDVASSADLLIEHKRIWDEKPTLRLIYADFHRRLETSCPDGPLLDIGGSSAHFKRGRSDVTSIDIVPFPGIDLVADAHRLPLKSDHFAGIVMLDVLHHLQFPVAFLAEAARVLRPGGRLAMIEPGMSVVAKQFYTHLHQEPVIMDADPFKPEAQSGNNPFDSNQAIPTLMFASKQGRDKVVSAVPDLAVVDIRWLSLLAYPLSGGFKSWCLWPAAWTEKTLRFEDALLPVLGPLLGFRLQITLEKRAI